MKNIVILGSTGSVGTQALEVIRNNLDRFNVVGLSCNSNTELLKKQIEEFNPSAVAIFEKEKADSFQSNVQSFSGMEGLLSLSKLSESDTVLNSLVGSIGIKPTVTAIENKKNILLANKETLVSAGDIINKKLSQNNTKLIPIDSEHSAIFQCLQGETKDNIKSITITCSGGPFRNFTLDQLKEVTKEDALKHPNWNMGDKITIDSATLMNKGLEIIEAHMLFNIDYENIKIVIHPQSIIHSMVEFIDTSVIAQLGWPDMKIPIQFALSYPDRIRANLKSLDLSEVSKLSFENPDFEKFQNLKYAIEAGKDGGTMPAVLNAANEVAVHNFLSNKISFLDIPKFIKKKMDSHTLIKNPELEEILDIDNKIKEEIN